MEPNPNTQPEKPDPKPYPKLMADTWYDALLKKLPAGWKPDPKMFMYAGFGLLIFLGVIAASVTNQTPTASPLPKSTIPPTLPPGIYEENPVSQKQFISPKHQFSFTHPGLSDQCCDIVGPTFGAIEALGNLSEPSTVRRGSGTPFNGLSLYVVELGDIKPDEYLKTESQNLKDQYKLLNGNEPTNATWKTLEVSDQPTVLLKNYNTLAVNRYYIQFPNQNKLLYIGASETTLGSFNASLNLILSSLSFENASTSASPNPQP